MSDFDYPNARLRAMKSRLLSRRTLEELAEASSVSGLLTALTNTAHREAVETALAHAVDQPPGLESLTDALRRDIEHTLGRVRAFFPAREQAARLAEVVLRRSDLHNVKTILRGLARQLPADQVLASTLPGGELRWPELQALARAVNVRAAIELLATWQLAVARPLLEAFTARQAESTLLPWLELSLERWHISSAQATARAAGDEGAALDRWLAIEADSINLLTALRLVGLSNLPAALREHFRADSVEALFVAPGRVPLPLLLDAVRRSTVGEAVELLRETAYGPSLASVADASATGSHLSRFEQALAHYRLRQAVALYTGDPLGIGILIGYAALKANEIINLRQIGNGLYAGNKPEAIRASLIWVEGMT